MAARKAPPPVRQALLGMIKGAQVRSFGILYTHVQVITADHATRTIERGSGYYPLQK